MTDQPTPNICPGYEVVLTVREIDGTLRFRCMRVVTWQLDAEATRDDGKWDQEEKGRTLGRTAVECASELITWCKGQTL